MERVFQMLPVYSKILDSHLKWIVPTTRGTTLRLGTPEGCSPVS